MNKAVNDVLVAEYVRRLRAGGPLGEVFSWPVSECEFTTTQRATIKQARAERARLQKKSNPQPPAPPQPQKAIVIPRKAPPNQPSTLHSPSLSKLEKMLYLQRHKCFFCGEQLPLAAANIEHLHPLSLGGKRTEDNEVACHKSLNETFGNLPLKRKFEFVLKSAGSFQCPGK